MHVLSSEQPEPFRLLRARAAASIESVADAVAAASVTPDRAISGARAAFESESSRGLNSRVIGDHTRISIREDMHAEQSHVGLCEDTRLAA